jgi:RHS repeat-associated protein
VDDVIAVIRDGQTYFFHKDQQGSLTAVTDGTGNLVEKYRYDAYGATYVQSGSIYVPLSDMVKPFSTRLYTGREYDSETGLYHYRARTYSPSLGRFLQRDPVDTEDQVNLYAYVGNNPVNRTDPSGKFGLAGLVISVGIGAGLAYYDG